MSECWLCEENGRQAAGHSRGSVAELVTGWVRLHPRQRYRGAAFFVAKSCVREVYHLDSSSQATHFRELATVAEAVEAVFRPVKMNIESLGNGIPHLHWWITPRHADDPRPRGPIWENLDFLREMWTGTGLVDGVTLDESAALLRAELVRRSTQGGIELRS